MINSTAALRGTFILELVPPKHVWAFFVTIVRENLANRRGFLLIRAQFVLHSAYRNCFLNFRAVQTYVLMLFC